MRQLDETEYFGFSNAKYLENDPINYNIDSKDLHLFEHQPSHFHDDIELFYVLSGEAVLLINGETNKLSPGCLVMLLPYHVHEMKLTSSHLHIYKCSISLGLLLFSSITRSVEKYIANSLAYGNVVVLLGKSERKSVIESYNALFEESKNQEVLYTMFSLLSVIRLILLFCRNITKDLSTKKEYSHTLSWKLMEFMNHNFSTDLSAKSIGVEFQMSPLQVNHAFYLLTGDNLSTNLHRTRIRHACCMLQFEQLSTNYIATYVGYKNSSSFFRKFKEIKHMTPDEYRKSHSADDSIYHPLNPSWKILLYLYEHFQEPLTEEIISKALFLSPEIIRHELMSNFDSTLSDMLTNIRIQYARSYLKALDEPVLKIAYHCGFSSVRTFNRCFKSIVGVTPSDFRKQSP